MKQRFLSLCVAIVMILTTVLGVVPAPAVQAAELPETIVVKGDRMQAKHGDTTIGEESNGVKYLHIDSTQWANGEFPVDFKVAGKYQMSFLAAVKTAPSKFHIDVLAPGLEATDSNWTNVYKDQPFFTVTEEGESYNNYTEFTGGPVVTIEKPGTYTFKIGSWAAGADFRLAEVRFDATEIVEPYDPNKVYTVAPDEETTLNVGDLRTGIAVDSYIDYKLDVAKEGDYTLTYTMGKNNLTDGATTAFQAILNPDDEEAKVESHAMTITKYWADLPIKQTIHLNAGEQVLRVQALAADFSIKNIAINSKTVHTVAGTTEIPASQYADAEGFHAIENDGNNIGYSAEGLKMDYAINVEKSGTYTISYEYVSENDAGLETQIDETKVADSSVDASTVDPWYNGDYAETDPVSFRLEKGLHTLSVVWGSADINVKSINLTCKTPDPDPVTIVVEGEDGVNGSGAWAAQDGEETVNDETVKYATFPQRWANGRYIVHFPYAGTYKMQLVMSVPTLTDSIHLEWSPTTDEYTAGNTFTTVANNIPGITATAAGEYKTFDGPNLVVEEAGYYDLKFGSWAEKAADFRLDKFIFTCENPIAPPSTDEPLVVEKGKALTLKEALAVNKEGSLKSGVAAGNYADYVIEVKDTGDYRLTYTIGANDNAVEDAFQIQVAPQKEDQEDLKDADFTTKLEPVQMTHYYATIQERQSIHLEAGKYILRTKALNEGFTLTQLVISDVVVTDVAAEETTTINAVEYNNGYNYHAIQNATATSPGNIGYSSQGLEIDFSVNIAKGGVYNIGYTYQAAGDYTLTTKRVADGTVYDLAVSQLEKNPGTGSWYDGPKQASEPTAILLPEGANILRVHWDQADINLHDLSLTYQGSAVDYVKGLLEALPAKDVLTLEDTAAVTKAKNSYDTLTEDEKEEIEEALLTKLNEDIAQIAVLELAKAVDDNKKELEKEFSKYVESEYRAEKWADVVAAKDAGLEEIGKAATIADANKALKDAKAAMAAVVKKLKPIVIPADGTVILAQSKAYRKNGFLNSNVAVGNYADYFIDVKEAGVYTFTYALYADEAVENAFAVKYDASEYPETVTNEYAKVSVPKIEVEGSLVKEIRETITLNAGEQTLRFEALSDKVRLNRITIQKQKTAEVGTMVPGEEKVVNASDFAEAAGSYVLANNVVTGTAAGTTLDYLVSIPEETAGFVSFNYAYAGDKEPELELAVVAADGTVTTLASIKAAATDGAFADSEQAAVVLPKGNYTLRVIMKNDGVDLKSFAVSGDQKNIPATGIKLNAVEVNLNLAGTFQLEAALEPANTTASVTWSSSDESVAKVDSYGVVTAVKGGTAVITAAAADGIKAECTVNVNKEEQNEQGQVISKPDKVPSFIAKVAAEFEKTTLYAGGNADNTVKAELVIPTGAALAKAEYASSNASVASVSAAGVVTAKKAGTAVITVKVTLTNGESASLQKQITVKKAYIKMKKTSYTVKKGKSVQLKATAFGSSKKVTFKMANKKSKKLAKVTKTGRLTGKAKGTAKVIAKAGKVKKTFKVKVK